MRIRIVLPDTTSLQERLIGLLDWVNRNESKLRLIAPIVFSVLLIFFVFPAVNKALIATTASIPASTMNTSTGGTFSNAMSMMGGVFFMFPLLILVTVIFSLAGSLRGGYR